MSDIVDRVAVQHEGHAQLDQPLRVALAGQDARARGRDGLLVTGADGRKRTAGWSLDIDDAAPPKRDEDEATDAEADACRVVPVAAESIVRVPL